MAARRKHKRALPLGHKPRGHQRTFQQRRAHNVQQGPTAQQSVVGTQTTTPRGAFSSAAGGAGYRTLQAPPLARAPVQPFSLGGGGGLPFFAPFALAGAPFGRTTPAVPFSNAAAGASSPSAATAPTSSPTSSSSTPQRSTVFAPPK